MVSSHGGKGGETTGGLKNNLTFRRLCIELENLSPERREAAMKFLDEKSKGEGKEKAMVRPDEVAILLGVPATTIRRWLREGRIKGIKISRTWLIPREEIERILSMGT